MQLGNDRRFMAWGVQIPATSLDTNVNAGAKYQPAAGGTSKPIPTLARAPITGPSPSQPNAGGSLAGGFYFYNGSFVATSDSCGNASVFGWDDANNFSSQLISLANGFQIGNVPEPTSVDLLGMGFAAVIGANRCRMR